MLKKILNMHLTITLLLLTATISPSLNCATGIHNTPEALKKYAQKVYAISNLYQAYTEYGTLLFQLSDLCKDIAKKIHIEISIDSGEQLAFKNVLLPKITENPISCKIFYMWASQIVIYETMLVKRPKATTAILPAIKELDSIYVSLLEVKSSLTNSFENKNSLLELDSLLKNITALKDSFPRNISTVTLKIAHDTAKGISDCVQKKFQLPKQYSLTDYDVITISADDQDIFPPTQTANYTELKKIAYKNLIHHFTTNVENNNASTITISRDWLKQFYSNNVRYLEEVEETTDLFKKKSGPKRHFSHDKKKKKNGKSQSSKTIKRNTPCKEQETASHSLTETTENQSASYRIYETAHKNYTPLYTTTTMLPITYTETISTWFNNPQSILKTDMRYNNPHAPHASLTTEKQADTIELHQGIPLEMDREAMLNGYQSIKKESDKDIVMVHTPVLINEKNGFMKYLLEKDGNNLKCFHRNFHPFALEACKGEDAIVIQLFFDMCQKEQSFYEVNFPSLAKE